MERPITIANYFIDKAIKTNEPVSPLKLLKLVYLAHGWYLGLQGDPLIDETVQAWKYGPVVPSIYHSFKHYGNEQITKLDYDIFSDSYIVPQQPEIISFLDKVWDVYKKYSAVQLSALTHEKNSPWDIVWNQQGGSQELFAPIDNSIIKTYYQGKAAS